MAAIASPLGVLSVLPSTCAAILVSARVAFLHIVSVFMSGTVPMSRLKTRVDFSASLTVSLKLASSGLSRLAGAATGTWFVPAAYEIWLTVLTVELSLWVFVLSCFGTALRLTMLETAAWVFVLVCETELPRALKRSCCTELVSLMASTMSVRIT